MAEPSTIHATYCLYLSRATTPRTVTARPSMTQCLPRDLSILRRLTRTNRLPIITCQPSPSANAASPQTAKCCAAAPSYKPVAFRIPIQRLPRPSCYCLAWTRDTG